VKRAAEYKASSLNAPPTVTDPPFAQFAEHADWLALPWDDWLAGLNERAPAGLRFVEQTPALVSDGLGYEERIGLHRRVAVRRDSWHDRFGALMWLSWPESKWAIHGVQMAGIRAHGPKQRSRRQQAVAHVDEAGLVLLAGSSTPIQWLHAHDWQAIAITRRDEWLAMTRVLVLGHALLELRRERPHDLLAGKTITLVVPPDWLALPDAALRAKVDPHVAAALLDGRAAGDPAVLPTLPLAAIPGWDERNRDPGFIASAPCFRPARADRRYAGPIVVEG
jgi:hypothetical protein